VIAYTAEYEETLRRATQLAHARDERAVSSTHLLLAVMSQAGSPWPLLVLERGGLNFRNSIRRLRWKRAEELLAAARSEAQLYRSPVRVMVAVFLARIAGVVIRARRITVARPAPVWTMNAYEVLSLAARFGTQGAPRDPTPTIGVGHLLLALASSPGRHLRLIDGGTVIACAVRKQLGLAAWHHRLVLACDRPKMTMRRWSMRLDREVSAHGRRSRWGLAWAADGLAGLLISAAVLPITLAANVILYLFLWPSALLMAGLRSICGLALGLHTSNHRWHEIPGGELGLAGVERRIPDARVAALVLLPRLLALALSVTALTVIAWRSNRLGVVAFPTFFARPDIADGHAAESFWVTPLTVFTDMLKQDGGLGGIGLLAGAGLGLMSVPTYRELNLIRLYAGHDVGRGSRLARRLTLPASIMTGLIACIEAVLPFRNGPIYLTVYAVPLAFSLMLAIFLTFFLPY
jgi:hypothetical protein